MKRPITRSEEAGSSLHQHVATVAGIIIGEDFPTGERARLRRWAPGSPASLAFYRFAFRHLPQDWERQQDSWHTLVTAIALLFPYSHRADLPLGKALAANGYSEARLERLLSADGVTLQTLLLRAVRFLRAKNTGCNCVDLTYLLGLGGSHRDIRLRIARGYYRELHSSQTRDNGR